MKKLSSATDKVPLVIVIENSPANLAAEGRQRLFWRCFQKMRLNILCSVEGKVRKRNSVHAYCEMMRAAKIFNVYGSSRFKVEGPNDEGLFLVETAHDFGNGLKFQSHWTTVDKGKELVAYQACKYFAFFTQFNHTQ